MSFTNDKYWLTRFGGLQSTMLQRSCTKGPTVECLYWSFSWICQLFGGIFFSRLCFCYIL